MISQRYIEIYHNGLHVLYLNKLNMVPKKW